MIPRYEWSNWFSYVTSGTISNAYLIPDGTNFGVEYRDNAGNVSQAYFVTLKKGKSSPFLPLLLLND